MQSSSAHAVQSQSTLRLKETISYKKFWRWGLDLQNLGMKWVSGELTVKLILNKKQAQFK